MEKTMTAEEKLLAEIEHIADRCVHGDISVKEADEKQLSLINQFKEDVKDEILLKFQVQSKGIWTIHEIIDYLKSNP